MTAAYALLPGAGGDAWYWHRVTPLLQSHGAEVIAVDLPAADASAGLTEYRDAALAAVSHVDRLIVVAQSMGAYTAGLVAAQRAVDLVVLVNPMTPAAGESPGSFWQLSGQAAAGAEYRLRIGLGRTDFDPVEDFFHDVPHTVREQAFALPEPQQADKPLEQPWPLAAWPDVPTRVLQGADDRLFPLDFQRRIVRERLGLAVDAMPGGHLMALSQPDELAERLERYRAEAGLSTRGGHP